MKKILLIATLLVLVLAMFTGCAAKPVAITMQKELDVKTGSTQQLTVKMEFEKEMSAEDYAKAVEANKITYKSSDESIVAVNDAGVVTGVDGGKATITATVGTDVTASCEVTVIIPAESITTKESILLTMTEGEEASDTVDAIVLPTKSTEKVIYTSDNEEVATVDEKGKVVAVGKGECIITATAGEVSAETPVTVKIGITGITLESNGATLTVGYKTQIKAHTTPVAADAISYTYASANSKIATVDGNGNVTAKAAGSTTISVSGGGYTVSFSVTVKAKPVSTSSNRTPTASGSTTASTQSGGSTNNGGGSTNNGGGSTNNGGSAPAAPSGGTQPSSPSVNTSTNVGLDMSAGHDVTLD